MSPEFRTVFWRREQVCLIDQTKLPTEEVWLELSDYHQVAEAIKTMRVRGAPAIGVAAALGLALVAAHSRAATTEEMILEMKAAASVLENTRPTAVNLAWALKRILKTAKEKQALKPAEFKQAIIAAAEAIQEKDVACNRELGRLGAELIEPGDTILTHCNAGALACAGYGTALGVIRAAWEAGKQIHVFVDETRPLLQGARLSAWELARAGIPVTLITDNMAGHFMRQGRVQRVVVGADRIAANGDTANKIGTYAVAVLAAAHKIPFYVAAPTSTIDLSLSDGSLIPIEERAEEEVTGYSGVRWAPGGVKVANPAFDVTPHDLIAAVITEKGVLYPPFNDSLRQVLGDGPDAGK